MRARGSEGALMSHYSFFHLTAQRPTLDDDTPLRDLTPDEFDACVVEGHPLLSAATRNCM